MYEFENIRFDPANHLLLNGEEPVPLTPKAFDVLLVLVQNGSRLTTKEELMSKVWPDSFVEEANLTVNISALRKALGDGISGRSYIETVPKKGYRFLAVVRKVEPKASQPATEVFSGTAVTASTEIVGAADLARETPQRITAGRFSRRLILVVGALLLVLGVSTYFFFRGPKRDPVGGKQAHRLAVLPFQNLRENTESDFLGFSLADAIIAKLGYVSELSVRPSYAVQKYKGQAMDVRKVAHELNADALLTGTFLREGDDLRISCQLIDAKGETILWKGTFDVKYDKLLTVQDEVAEQIIKGMELTLSESEAGRLRAAEAVTPMAYEYYLRGVDLYANGDFPMAVRLLEKSTELAPNYPLAWANLGKAYTANASFQLGGDERYEKAQAAFKRALQLQPDLIEARIYMANMLTDTGQVEQAVPLLRDALRTNPNHAEIHWELGYAYRFAGMLDASVAESEIARNLDPTVKLSSSTLNGYLYLGKYDEFLESLPEAEDQPLLIFYRGLGEYYKKNWEAAGRQFDLAYERDHSLFPAQIGKALSYGLHSQTAQGLAILRNAEIRITQSALGDPEACYKLAQAYAVLGDKASALRVLKRSVDGGFFPYPYLASDPLLDSIRSAPEFRDLLNAARARHQQFARSFF